MDKMFATGGLRTYGKRRVTRNTHPVQQEMNNILFAEKAFRETEDPTHRIQNDKGDTKKTRNRMSQNEKVRNWLEKSSCYFVDSSEYCSIEVMRESQHTAINRKSQLFDDYEVLPDNESSLIDNDPVQGFIRMEQDRFRKEFIAGLQQEGSPPVGMGVRKKGHTPINSSSVLDGGQSKTDNGELHSSGIHDSRQSKNNTSEKPAALDGPKKRKYLNSTRKSGVSATPSFPTDLSSIDTDGRTIQKMAEITPKHKDDFRLPRVASKKCKRTPGRRKPQPRSSTRLILTGCEDGEDISPGLSSMRPDSQCAHTAPAEQAKKDLTSFLKTEEVINDDDVHVRNKQCEHAPIITSTPNKDIPENGDPFFEFDISSVGVETDDEILHPRQSTKVINSEEIISLSNIMVDSNEFFCAGVDRGTSMESYLNNKQTSQVGNIIALLFIAHLAQSAKDVFIEKAKLLKDDLKESAHTIPKQKIHQTAHCNEEPIPENMEGARSDGAVSVSHPEEDCASMKQCVKVPVRKRGKKVATVDSNHGSMRRRGQKVATVHSNHGTLRRRQQKVATIDMKRRRQKIVTVNSDHAAHANCVESECDRHSGQCTRQSARRNYANTKHAESQSSCANSVYIECDNKSWQYTPQSERKNNNKSTTYTGTASNSANSVDSEFGKISEHMRLSKTNQNTSYSANEMKTEIDIHPSVQSALKSASCRSRKPRIHMLASSGRLPKNKCVSASSTKSTFKTVYDHDVEMCTFWRNGFTCPFNNLSKRLQGKVKHEMSYHELIKNICIDDLL